MLARYKMYRGTRPLDDPLPQGIRCDTRYKTKHCLRPGKEHVEKYLANPSGKTWQLFMKKYLSLLESRFSSDRTFFDKLAEQAIVEDIWLGCSCPTQKNPDVYRCHTVLALRFMKQKYPDIKVVLPQKD
ncbi:MAG: hypothetical protein IH984_07085 [Planctomycetes bacterium]|nr:hypothetical protein [Planctomycetota bacterium]